MILIALLIALSIERVTQLPAFWQMDVLLQRWFDWSQTQLSERRQQQLHHPALQALWLLLPALLSGLFVAWLDHGLVTFVASIIALLVAISCDNARQAYKGYLKAANSGDQDALAVYRQQLQQQAGNSCAEQDNTAATVGWINYQQYVAVTFFFLLFGVFGALAYASIRSADKAQPAYLEGLPIKRLRWALDFIPVRLTGLGLLLVGHFSRAFPVWLQSLTNLSQSQPRVLASLLTQAEDSAMHHPDDKTEAVGAQLGLMKRQYIAWLCVIALLTLSGSLH